jgi:hypothetical protein
MLTSFPFFSLRFVGLQACLGIAFRLPFGPAS